MIKKDTNHQKDGLKKCWQSIKNEPLDEY